jgi:hypothetical protein
MQTLKRKKIALAILAIVSCGALVTMSQPPWPNMFYGNHVIGQLTNGFGASLMASDARSKPVSIKVFVINTNAGGFWGGPEPAEHDTSSFLDKVFGQKLLYFMPT